LTNGRFPLNSAEIAVGKSERVSETKIATIGTETLEGRNDQPT